MNSILVGNLEALRGHYPELAILYHEPVGIERVMKGSYPSIRFKGVLVHSEYDPISEAKRFIDKIPLECIDLLFVFGFGLGYHLKELNMRIDHKLLIIVIEPEFEIFFAALSLIDLRDILKSYQFELSIGKDEEGFIERLNKRFELINIKKVYILKHSPSFRLNPTYFDRISQRIKDFIDYKITQTKTIQRFGYDFQRNIIRNIPWIFKNPGIKELFGRFASIPAIIIAAGPSLDKDLEILRMAKGKALLISVDTALTTLVTQGVIPDLVVSIDPQDVNLRYLKDIDLSDIFLILGSIVYYGIAELEAPKFFFLSDHPICDLIKGFDDKGMIDISGGSVTTASFDLAIRLGAEPIILVGTDFSYLGGLSYTRGLSRDLDSLSRFHTLEMANREFLKKRSTFFIEGIYDDVLTDKVLYGYLTWLEQRIKGLSGKMVINSSYGARIKGVKELSLKECIKLYCKEDLSIKRIIDDSFKHRSKVDLFSFIQEIESICKELRMIEELSKEYSLVLKRLKEGEAEGIKKVIKGYVKTMRLLEIILYSKTFNELYGISREDNINRDLIWAKGLIEASSFTQGLFKELIVRIQSEL